MIISTQMKAGNNKPGTILSLVLVFASCLFSRTGFAQEVVHITGSLTGQQDGTVVLTYPGAAGGFRRDTATVNNGIFSFTVQLAEPVMASLSGNIKSRGVDDPNFTGFFVEPRKDITIHLVADHFKEAIIQGSSIQDEYAQLLKAKQVITGRYQQQLDSLRTERDHEKNAAIRERLAPYFNEMDEEDYRFFSEHPASYVTAYLLRFHISDLDADLLDHYYQNLGTSIQQSSYGKYIAEEITKLRHGSPGAMALDFTTSDINGKQLSLSSFRGKYVLIDFWASWCVPCRKGSPHLKELYSKYKEKGLEIIGVADDDRAPQAWRAAVQKDETGSWYHVLRGLKFNNGDYDRSTDISENFGIHTLPTRILIDKNGKIIGRFGEKEEELDTMLKDLFDN